MSHSLRNATIIATVLLAACGTTIAQELEALPDPLIVQLNERAARGGNDLAESIGAFARIGEWELVEKWLAPVAAINDEGALAEMAHRIGPPILLRISGRADLSSNSIEAVRKLGAAARKQLESKDRLVAAISGLAGSTDQRLAAMRVLLAGSDAAVAALIEASVSPQPPAPRDEILRTLASMGNGGQLALAQLSLYGEPPTRTRALEALIRIAPRGSTNALLTALHAADSTTPEIEFAKTKLQRLTGTAPSKREAVAVLLADLRQKRELARLSENDTQTTTIWSVNANRTGVNHQRTRRIMAAYRDATDAGARLRRIGGLAPNVLNLSLAADINYRVMIDPDWGDTAQVDAMRTAYGSAVSGTGLSSAIANALDNNDFAAAVGMMRMIDKSATVLDRNILLLGKSPRLTPLVQATSHSNPRIRYEAASAIARLAPNVPYAGSSYVKRCLSEMRSLTHRPIALMVETRGDVIVQQEQILGTLGFDVRVVGSVAALEREVARGSEVDLIVSKTQLADFAPIELIDRIRRMPRGRLVPIVFFGESAAGINTDRWDALTRLIEQPATPAVFADIIIGVDRIPRVRSEKDTNPPLAILVENRPEVIDRQELILEDLGYTVTVVKSLESLQQDLSKLGEVGLIVSAVQLPEMRPEKLVDLVRRQPQGKGVLIAFYRESLSGLGLEEWDPFSRRVNYPNTAAAYSNILLDIASAQRLPPLTALDRRLYRQVASQVLADSRPGG